MLGRVVSIEEGSGLSAPAPRRALPEAAGMQMPIAPGENTLHASVTMVFERTPAVMTTEREWRVGSWRRRRKKGEH